MPRDWDEHYSKPANLDPDPDPLLVEVAGTLPPGRALDLACGTGRNALYLASLGWRVTAVDGSAVAIRILRRAARQVALEAHVADLEKGGFLIAPAAYHLICDFYYLQRDLFQQIREGVHPGGVFAGAIHLVQKATTPPSPCSLENSGTNSTAGKFSTIPRAPNPPSRVLRPAYRAHEGFRHFVDQPGSTVKNAPCSLVLVAGG